MQDSPLGVRFADYVSAFPAGGTVAASWDRGEFYRRGYQMGQEHRSKGVDVQLGPALGPLGRNPKGGVSSSRFVYRILADQCVAQLGGLFPRPVPDWSCHR
jgi:beta-glucosidase-like glycosyl hydrolase